MLRRGKAGSWGPSVAMGSGALEAYSSVARGAITDAVEPSHEVKDTT